MKMRTSAVLVAVILAITAVYADIDGDDDGFYLEVGPCETSRVSAGQCTDLHECPALLKLHKMPVKPGWVLKYISESGCAAPVKGDMFPTIVCCPLNTTVLVEEPGHQHQHLINREMCGPSWHDRMFRGSLTARREYLWTALLRYNRNGKLEEECSGSLINEKYVLTSAHCINDALAEVELGVHDLRTDKPDCEKVNTTHCEVRRKSVQVLRTIRHPSYSVDTGDNDIALIELKTPVDVPKDAQVLCLPFEGSELRTERAKVVGWGFANTNHSDVHKRWMSVPYLSTEECRAAVAKDVVINDRQICTGVGKDPALCTADPGAPLFEVSKGGRLYVQFGIVSHGPRRCATADHPAVYTDVRKYMSWVLDNIAP